MPSGSIPSATRRHRGVFWLIGMGLLFGLIAVGGYLVLPLGYPEAERYFDSPPARELQADEAGQLRTLMEDYFLLSVTGDDFPGWDPARRDFWKYRIAFSSYGLPSAMIIDPEHAEDYKALFDTMIWKMKSRRVWDDFIDRGFGDDPITHQNIMYKGHLNLMFGLYQLTTGDLRYAREYTWLTEQIRDEMRRHHEGHYEGVTCEPHAWFPECNAISLLSLHVYDRLFGTRYTEQEISWTLEFLTARMRDPETGLFYRLYRPHHDSVDRRIDGYTNGWLIAFLHPLLEDEMRQAYVSYSKHLVQRLGPYAGIRGRLGGAADPTAQIFGLWAAKEMGDVELFGQLRNAADKLGKLHTDPVTLAAVYDHEEGETLNGVILSAKMHVGWRNVLEHDWGHKGLPYPIPETRGMDWTDLLPTNVYRTSEPSGTPRNADRLCPSCFWGEAGLVETSRARGCLTERPAL